MSALDLELLNANPMVSPEGLQDIGISKAAIGSSTGLKKRVLSLVVEERYEQALQSLDRYIEGQTDFLAVKPKTELYRRQIAELVRSIQKKRSIPNLSTLRQARKQEIIETVKAQFEEIKIRLQKIEKVELELRIEDVRSTVIFVKAVAWAVVFLGCSYVLFDLNRYQYWTSLSSVLFATLDNAATFIVGLF